VRVQELAARYVLYEVGVMHELGVMCHVTEDRPTPVPIHTHILTCVT
jgi:hypothetical protein